LLRDGRRWIGRILTEDVAKLLIVCMLIVCSEGGKSWRRRSRNVNEGLQGEGKGSRGQLGAFHPFLLEQLLLPFLDPISRTDRVRVRVRSIPARFSPNDEPVLPCETTGSCDDEVVEGLDEVGLLRFDATDQSPVLPLGVGACRRKRKRVRW